MTPTSSAPRSRSRRSSGGRWRSSARSWTPTGSRTTGSASACATQTTPNTSRANERWSRAEESLRIALDASGIEYYPGIGEANFYGPKADFIAKDVLGREWQLSTIQVDFFQPGRLGCEYVGEDGKMHTPVLLHRAVTGSTERFMAVLIEHYGGAFPVWLSPVQAVV